MAGVKSADPADGIKTNVRLHDDYLQIADRSYRLSNIRNILVVGCGKAAAKMALAIEDLLGDRVAGGILLERDRDVGILGDALDRELTTDFELVGAQALHRR